MADRTACAAPAIGGTQTPVQRGAETDPLRPIRPDPPHPRPRHRHALSCPRRGIAQARALPRDVRACLAAAFGTARPHAALVGTHADLGPAEPNRKVPRLNSSP